MTILKKYPIDDCNVVFPGNEIFFHESDVVENIGGDKNRLGTQNEKIFKSPEMVNEYRTGAPKRQRNFDVTDMFNFKVSKYD